MSLLEAIFDVKAFDLEKAEELFNELCKENILDEEDVNDVYKNSYESSDNIDPVAIVYDAALIKLREQVEELHEAVEDVTVYANCLNTSFDCDTDFRDILYTINKIMEIL